MTEIKRENLANEDKPEIFCNKCSMSCRGHIGNFNGLIEARVCGAYDSSHLEDGSVYKFSLCERCLLELFSTFKLTSHYRGSYLFLDENAPDYEEFKAEDDKRKEELKEFFEKHPEPTPIEDLLK